MIKRLQRKFILIVAVCLFIVEVLIIGAMNVINVVSINSDSDNIMNILVENGGRFPDFNKKPDGNPDDIDKGQDENDRPKMPANDEQNNHMTGETKYQTRYFVVYYNKNGDTTKVDTGHVATVETSEAIEYADEAIESGNKQGTMDYYRYTVTDTDEGKMVIFLNCHSSMNSKNRFLLISISIAAAGYLIVCILVTVFSKRAMRPVIISMEKQRQFITDAGHELKTPLAIISANAEVLEMMSEPNEWTISIRNQITRLNALLKNLLHLSKMEEDNVKVSFVDFNVSDAVFDVVKSFETLAASKDKKINADIENELYIHGDEAGIRQLASVLTENAVKYADADSEINVTLKKTANGRHMCFAVENSCKNPPEGDTTKLFDRFYRGDESHAREDGEKKGGYGIGLSIARAVIESHKGKINCRVEGTKVTFAATIRLVPKHAENEKEE